MFFIGKAKEDFNIEPISSSKMDAAINKWADIYKGNPEWLDETAKTINFAQTICSETARLATLAIGITVDGSSRAEWLQKQINNVYFKIREWVEYTGAYGTIVLKPNGSGIDMLTPGDFIITSQDNGEVSGMVFVNRAQRGKKYYTRLEYHRFLDSGEYAISNRCYVGESKNDISEPVQIELTPWAVLEEDTTIGNIEKPLYAVLKTPQANNIDLGSPMGMAIFAGALEELCDLDVAYSRNSTEIGDSERTVLLDSDKLLMPGQRASQGAAGFETAREQLRLPRYVRNVMGDGNNTFYQEINPSLNTEQRLTGINALLSQIGFKCGYSNGYFVFNEKTGMITATQVESDDRRTIQLIKDVRDKLEDALNSLVYALNAFADLYDLAPVGEYEITYDFGDITYNVEEDRARWWQYVQAGKVPAWKYFVKFEGMSEEDAKAMVEEATPKQETLFGDE